VILYVRHNFQKRAKTVTIVIRNYLYQQNQKDQNKNNIRKETLTYELLKWLLSDLFSVCVLLKVKGNFYPTGYRYW